jgi:hypothetical protein
MCTSKCDSLRVTITKPASVLFSGIFGIGDIRVSSGAAAGMRWQEVAVDSLVFLQTTSGMANPNGVCGAVPGPGTPTPTPGPDPSCPLSMQRYAAKQFVDFMFNQTGGRVQLGYSAYNYCYAPDWTPPPAHANECVISNHPGAGSPAAEVDLTTSSSALESAVDASIALGGTNVCLPLMEARRMFSVGQAQHGKDAKRVIVIVSDGDNNFQYGGALYPPTSPAPGCRPTAVAANGPCTGALPSAAERDMDTKAYQQAQALKQPTSDQQPVEIYVIGFRVCGSDNDNTQATVGYCSGIGDAAADAVADQRLLKCIASSPSDYFAVNNSSDLASTFTKIAERIIGQRLLQ